MLFARAARNTPDRVIRAAAIVDSLSLEGLIKMDFAAGKIVPASLESSRAARLRARPCVLVYFFVRDVRTRAMRATDMTALLMRMGALKRTSQRTRATRAGVESRRAVRLRVVISGVCARRVTHPCA